MPFGIALVGLGFSNTASGPLRLPFDLTVIGMTGCNLLADPVVLEVAAGVAPNAAWSFAIPNIPSALGVVLFGQGFSLDPSANPFGFTASNAARIKIGL